MIRVLIIDDHPAMRAGLEAALGGTTDLVPVGAGPDQHELWHLFKRTAPEVVLLDYHLPGEDGLTLCHRLKNTTLPPAVIIYSAYADMSLAIAAVVAGADGIVNKNAPAPELFEAIRRVAAGESMLPELPPDAVTTAAAKLEEEDRPLLSMLLDACTIPDVASTLHLPLDVAASRIQRIIGRLHVAVPGT
jgi:DNA-binding NarL/FixJ family response regulator